MNAKATVTKALDAQVIDAAWKLIRNTNVIEPPPRHTLTISGKPAKPSKISGFAFLMLTGTASSGWIVLHTTTSLTGRTHSQRASNKKGPWRSLDSQNGAFHLGKGQPGTDLRFSIQFQQSFKPLCLRVGGGGRTLDCLTERSGSFSNTWPPASFATCTRALSSGLMTLPGWLSNGRTSALNLWPRPMR